jgi:hypothetical protein
MTDMVKQQLRSDVGVARLGVAAFLLLVCPNCVTVYQPLTALQRPVVVDMQATNFEGIRILVRCIPGDEVDASESEVLCRSLRTLLSNQGAQVETHIPRRGVLAQDDEQGKPELIVEMRARRLHYDNPPLLWIISFASFTLLPAITENSIAQDVTILDANGALLASDSLQARFVRYFGAGMWAVNWALDLLVRPDSEDLTGDAPRREFSKDFYGQVSQLVFNARMRSVVLRSFEKRPAEGATN